ncbi:MAG: response regulator [Asticcacaulis sp.]|uniref:response regulator n=1 Tax=Asticcacaulis sp. TaxID=1872648 RepID=UPI0039E25F89
MSRQVLILEDSRTQAIIISKMFQRAGYESVCVTDMTTALEQLQTQSFDLLVLDVFIENYNTLDDLEAYRQLAPLVPIAIMTAGQMDNPDAGASALNKARRARVKFLLPKPFYFDDVKQVCGDVDAYWAEVERASAVAVAQ